MSEKTEQDYLRAINRIKSGNVTHPDLIKLASLGKLKLNVTNVAKEAGRSRTAIATEETPYPKVRNAILPYQNSEGYPQSDTATKRTTVQFHLLKSRAEVRTKEQIIQVLGTQLVSATKQIDELKLKLDKAEEKLARLSQARHTSF
ncbi:hypothetical protein F3Y33_18675 [Rhizobium sp. BG6]|uniref:hypothetical protein n=1 Tax=Rhizobium sp. BG6 TaxID=2613771 RepID=UPI00193D75D0|nr:hypothetical protein [Rhizobium sp. BG6]QRM51181.1 hypothetical protein F3Y33_18675 [Rhizobium sp. BG6]